MGCDLLLVFIWARGTRVMNSFGLTNAFVAYTIGIGAREYPRSVSRHKCAFVNLVQTMFCVMAFLAAPFALP